VVLGLAPGTDGNSVSGGEAPGSLGTAGTTPTIPDAEDVSEDWVVLLPVGF
jgi:hypothetical protein